MRVFQITVSYYPELQFGGPPQKIHALSRGLIRRGHEVMVATFRSSDSHSHDRVILDGVSVQYVSWLGSGTWRVPLHTGELAALVRRADVVHLYGLYNLLGPAVASLAQRNGRPFVLEPQGMFVPRARSFRLKRLYHRLFTSWMGRNAAKVIATSSFELEELSSLVPPDKLVLRRNGIDLEEFANLPSRAVFRHRYGIADDERIVLYIGRISAIKNLSQLLSAFQAASLGKTRLILIGPVMEPDYASRLHTLTDELALRDRVVFVGPLYGQDKLSALAAADLFVLPSLYESYGNAAAEAVAAGVPVLLTETCGIAAQISGRAGLAVSLGEAALAEGLRAMLDDEEQRQKVTRAQPDVLRELSWDEPLGLMEALYQAVIR
jgi:glycosyltransferase involved in cell wall biosynthesis